MPAMQVNRQWYRRQTPSASGSALGVYLWEYLAQESASAQWSPRTLASQATNADYLKALFDRETG